MGENALQSIYETVIKQGSVPVDLNLSYKVIFSTLNGNLPINNRIYGKILEYPVDLKLDYMVIPNTITSYPVNTRLSGVIGDVPVEADLSYKIVFSTIAGNIPVVSEIVFQSDNKVYRLNVPYRLVTGSALPTIKGGSLKKKKRVIDPKYKGGRLIEESGGASGPGIISEASRPIVSGIYGTIENIQFNLQLGFTYFCNTSSGRNPIPNRIVGDLSLVA